MSGDPGTDTWRAGDPYERYMGRWSGRVAPGFLAWLDIPPNQRWLDVGCGTGSLSDAILSHAQPAAVTAVDPSPGFLAAAAERLGGRVTFAAGSAEDLPLEDGSVDVAVSALVLNFTPSLPAALAEQSRVTARPGTVAAYVWDYSDRMDFLRLFWDSAIELDPAAAQLDEGARFPQCRPDALRSAFEEAGLGGVDVAPIDVETPFADFDDLWSPFLGGQGPAPSYVATLDDGERTALRDRLLDRVTMGSDDSITLLARAWAVRGRNDG